MVAMAHENRREMPREAGFARVHAPRPTTPHVGLDPEVLRLQARVDALERELAAATDRIRTLTGQLAEHVRPARTAPLMLHGRPVLTTAEAAQRAGVSVSQANRYLTSGWWSGVQGDNGHWKVYADQSLSRRPARRKRQ